jgi:glycosyltransferase involved in cell wall biosynthesis
MNYSVSVITICYNNLLELQETCNSVDGQTDPPQEHLIIDGSTNEEILNWLLSNQAHPFRRWIHERDKGIADAFNKGIQLASSSITHILNSGDKYYKPNAIAIVKEYFRNDGNLMWTHSSYVQHRGGVDVVSGSCFNKDFLWKGMRTVAHPSMFIKKELYSRHGLYNLQFKIAMDYDFLVRIRDEKFAFISTPLVYFSPGGASNIHFKKGLNEVKKSYFTHISTSKKLVFWQLRQQLLQLFMLSHIGKLWFRFKNSNQIIKTP